jgi:hypothetical protein
MLLGYGEKSAVPDPGRDSLPPLKLGATQVSSTSTFSTYEEISDTQESKAGTGNCPSDGRGPETKTSQDCRHWFD